MQWRRQARYYPDPVRGDVTQLGCQGGVFKEVMFELGSEGRGKGNRKRDGKNPGVGNSSMHAGCVANRIWCTEEVSEATVAGVVRAGGSVT